MIKCHKTNFHTTKSNLDRLFECNRISAEIWNDCLQVSRDYSTTNEGKWINKTELQKKLKRKYPLPSQTIQAVAHKYLQARDSTYKARLKDLDNKYPYKKKKYYNSKWVDKAFTIHSKGKINLHMGTVGGKRQKPITIWVKNIPKKDIKEIEIIYDRKLMVSISYDVIITGRKLRSLHQLRNKRLAELQKLMSKCKKGSRKWKKYNKAKVFLLSKSDAQLKDALHKTTKNFVDWCIKNKVKEVVIGKIEGVQRNTKGKRSKKASQKLSNWSFGKLQKYLEYKLAQEGIALKKIDESYTTQTCPVCGRRKKPSTRTYKCNCGYISHRDIHGARNILSRHLYGEIKYLGEIRETKYLRIA